jgi:hypothetical protein
MGWSGKGRPCPLLADYCSVGCFKPATNADADLPLAHRAGQSGRAGADYSRLYVRAFHQWTPPSWQEKTSGLPWRAVGCCHLSGLWCGVEQPPACMGVRGPGPFHPKRARSTVEGTGFPDPVSPTVAPYSPSARPTPSRPQSAHAAVAGAL